MKTSVKKYIMSASVSAMAVTFVVLLTLQLAFFFQTSALAEKQFSDSVKRAISLTSNAVEEEEITKIVEEISRDTLPEAALAKEFLKRNTTSNINQLLSSAKVNRGLLYEILARRYACTSDDRITKRVPHQFIQNALAENLKKNEIDMPFVFTMKCNETGSTYFVNNQQFDVNGPNCYSAPFFSHDASDYTYSMVVHFPDKVSFFRQHVRYMLPYSIAFLLLLILCIVTISYLFNEKQIGQMRNEFAQNMTHELKTPVASISLAAQMLSDKTIQRSEAMTSRMCDTILAESKRLVLLVDSVLQMSVLEQDGDLVNPSPLDVHEIINNAKNNMRLKVETVKKGEIRLSLNARNFIIEGEETHFTNIIFNLMDNAAKYASPDRLLLIEIKTYNQGDRLFIEVSDNGIGIDRASLKHIFEKYYRVPTGTLHNVKGFGLGLAYVNNMVRRHKGNIHVESEPGIGTRFTINLPIYKE